jgi:aryl-alcohol dehydrogenase-like predicted oxidoreductase
MSNAVTSRPATRSGTFAIGGELPVHRLGYGAMQITGPGVWGDPKDPAECIRVLQRAIELGVNFIDTADSYGPFVSEQLISTALRPYRDDLVIATKAGLTRTGPGQWVPVGRPAYLRQQLELSLRHLGLETIDLYQLHRIDRDVPLEDQIGTLAELRDEGKIRHIGLSEVGVAELEAARAVTPIATVQNLYNVANRSAEPLLEHCEQHGIGFIPWFPMATGELANPGGPLDELADETGVPAPQLALAWLLRRSEVMLPIPGTSKVAHLEQNVASAMIDLSTAQFESMSRLAAENGSD